MSARHRTAPALQWRLNELFDAIREARGKDLSLVQIAEESGISSSTIYSLTDHTPRRVDLNVLSRLMVYLHQQLGDLDTNDILRFEPPKES